MVAVGNLEIGGSINTAEIERGLDRVETGMKDVDRTGKSVNSDFVRMDINVGSLAKKFGLMGLAGATAMVAMAKGSPAVAGAMARMEVEAGKLSRTFGRILKPAFDLAAESFSKFTGFIQEHEGTFSAFVSVTLAEFEASLGRLKVLWTWISTNVKDLSAKIGIDIGWEKVRETMGKFGIGAFTPAIIGLPSFGFDPISAFLKKLNRKNTSLALEDTQS